MSSVLRETTHSAGVAPGPAGYVRFPGHHRIGAVLFDVDGTLYHQKPLRARMAIELLSLPLASRSIRRAHRVWRIISGFRRVREELRAPSSGHVPLDELQYLATAERIGVPVEEVRDVIRHWMFERPLRHLPGCMRSDLPRFLAGLRARRVKLGVFSDYPARDKLAALGVDDLVTVRLAATDSEINAFKPSPEGFLRACSLFELPPAQVLYVGDREDVDAAGAERAGMPCAILADGAPGDSPGAPARFRRFSSFEELRRELERPGEEPGDAAFSPAPVRGINRFRERR